MKKLIMVVMVLGTLATNSVFGQNRHKPVVPPTPAGVDYKSYLTSYMKKNADFQNKMLFTLNSGLRNAQSQTIVKNEHLEGVIRYTRFVDTTISFFSNSFRMDSARGPIYFYSQESYTGIVGVVNIQGVLICWIKQDCGNILVCSPVFKTVPTQNNIKVVEYVYLKDTVHVEKVIYREKERERESEREKIASETHMSKRTSFDYSHSSANEIEVLDVDEGAEFSIGLSGGGFSSNRQADGPFGASCETSSGGQGSLAFGYKAPSSTRYYRNSSASSSNTSTSSAASYGQSNGNNQNYQNQRRQQSGGRTQPSYGADPQRFISATTAD